MTLITTFYFQFYSITNSLWLELCFCRDTEGEAHYKSQRVVVE